MAKKTKTTTIVEEDPQEPQELDYKKDLENKSFEQVALPAKEEPVEKTPEDKPAEEETESVEFDPEQLKKEAAEMAKAEILESLKGKDATETADNVDHYQKFQEDFLKANNRQPTWFEVARDMEEQAILKLEAKQAEALKQREEEQATQKATLEKQNEDTNKYIKDTLDELYTNEKLPQIKDAKNKDDYGRKVQDALLQKVVEVNSARMQNNLTPKTLKEIFYEDFEMPRSEVAGANAPVNMGRGGFTPDDEQTIDYKRDLQGQSFRRIINQALGRK